MNYQVSIKDIEEFQTNTNQINTASSAIVIIEMQNYYNSHLEIIIDSQLNNISKLLKFAKLNNTPIFFIRHSDSVYSTHNVIKQWGKNIEFKSNDWEIIPSLDITNAIIIDKNNSSAFNNTKFSDIIRDLEIKDIILCGNIVSGACESTAREAFMNGLNVFIVNDAVSTIRNDLHISALRVLAFSCATIVNTDDVIKS